VQEMTFRTVGVLPIANGRWHVREGGGHIWFVNENPEVCPYCLQNGVFVAVVDAGVEPQAPLIQPRVPA
jgi:hypothetical protein